MALKTTRTFDERQTTSGVPANGDWLNRTQTVTRPEPVGEGHHDVERGQEEDEVEEEVTVGHALALVVDHLLTPLVLVINHHLLLCGETRSHRNQNSDERIETIIIMIEDWYRLPDCQQETASPSPYWLGFIGLKTFFVFYL